MWLKFLLHADDTNLIIVTLTQNYSGFGSEQELPARLEWRLSGETEHAAMTRLASLLGRILCCLGFHDHRVVNVTDEFGADAVEKDKCRCCGAIRTRIVRSG